MNEKFLNENAEMQINEKGIYHRLILSDYPILFPFGSMDLIEYGLFGLKIKSGTIVRSYSPCNKDEKKKLKDLMPTLESLNRSAEYTKPILNYGKEEVKKEEIKLEKNLESIKGYFKNNSLGNIKDKHEYQWDEYIENLLKSMDDDEEILHGFDGNLMYINGQRESITNYIAIITNKKFYYVGAEGKAVMFFLKSGSIELKDVHAISYGSGTMTELAHIKFDVNNDDYKMHTLEGIAKKAKEYLDKAVKECGSKTNATIVQAAVSSADELKKFKELLDMGIITQDEFDAKKKQLLGL